MPSSLYVGLCWKVGYFVNIMEFNWIFFSCAQIFSLTSSVFFLSGMGYIVGSKVDSVAKDWHYALRVRLQDLSHISLYIQRHTLFDLCCSFFFRWPLVWGFWQWSCWCSWLRNQSVGRSKLIQSTCCTERAGWPTWKHFAGSESSSSCCLWSIIYKSHPLPPVYSREVFHLSDIVVRARVVFCSRLLHSYLVIVLLTTAMATVKNDRNKTNRLITCNNKSVILNQYQWNFIVQFILWLVALVHCFFAFST